MMWTSSSNRSQGWKVSISSLQDCAGTVCTIIMVVRFYSLADELIMGSLKINQSNPIMIDNTLYDGVKTKEL